MGYSFIWTSKHQTSEEKVLLIVLKKLGNFTVIPNFCGLVIFSKIINYTNISNIYTCIPFMLIVTANIFHRIFAQLDSNQFIASKRINNAKSG